MMHQLIQEQFLPIQIEQAWDFFSTPANLNLITPPDMHFQITSELPVQLSEGLIITYKVAPLLKIPLTWHTKILDVEKPYKFSDTQIKGPYKFWLHEHTFRRVEGGVLMKDVVSYEIGMRIIGEMAGRLFVHKKIKSIFNYRRQVLNHLFQSGSKLS